MKKTKIPDTLSQEIISEDQRIHALVRFIARRAAEKDYYELLAALKNNPDYDLDDIGD